jgi:hypothetical protein
VDGLADVSDVGRRKTEREGKKKIQVESNIRTEREVSA